MEMRKWRKSVATIALATAAAFFCSGCLAMMVPGLAYSGYKYEHDKNNGAQSASNTQSNKSTSSTQPQKLPDNEIK
jgi:hypothetical protein